MKSSYLSNVQAGGITTWLPLRIWPEHTSADLTAMGIRLTGELEGNQIHAVLPVGWKVISTEASLFQRQVIDEQGKVRLRLYDHPGSAGGGSEICEDGPSNPL